MYINKTRTHFPKTTRDGGGGWPPNSNDRKSRAFLLNYIRTHTINIYASYTTEGCFFYDYEYNSIIYTMYLMNIIVLYT